ncbi:hypothetical protein [Eisenbergiella sp.]
MRNIGISGRRYILIWINRKGLCRKQRGWRGTYCSAMRGNRHFIKSGTAVKPGPRVFLRRIFLRGVFLKRILIRGISLQGIP